MTEAPQCNRMTATEYKHRLIKRKEKNRTSKCGIGINKLTIVCAGILQQTCTGILCANLKCRQSVCVLDK